MLHGSTLASARQEVGSLDEDSVYLLLRDAVASNNIVSDLAGQRLPRVQSTYRAKLAER